MNAALLIEQALAAFALSPNQIEATSGGESLTRYVRSGGNSFLLRIHEKGFQSIDRLRSTLSWLDALAAAGFHVPKALESPDGRRVIPVGPRHLASVTRWLPGEPCKNDDPQLYRPAGRLLARLHEFSRTWTPPAWFTRPRATAAELLDGVDAPTPTPECLTIFDASTKARLKSAIDWARPRFEAAFEQDVLLLHADPHGANFLWHPEGLTLIDFDDCAFLPRAYDLATCLIDAMHRDDWRRARDDLFAGYAEIAPPPAMDDQWTAMLVVRSVSVLLYMAGCGVREPGRLAEALAFAPDVLRILQRLDLPA